MGSRHAEITGQPHKRSCGLDIYSPGFAQCRESDRRHVVVAHAIDYGEVAYLRGHRIPPHRTVQMCCPSSGSVLSPVWVMTSKMSYGGVPDDRGI
jgi:hypothetical protein